MSECFGEMLFTWSNTKFEFEMHTQRLKNIMQPYKVQLELRGRLRDGLSLRWQVKADSLALEPQGV